MEGRRLTKEDIDRVRGIEGFPIAKDEDIIALSRPPYYTACPNPFIADFIKEHGTPYDEATDDYHREPFAADVSEGKNDPIYMAHSYHTKVPYKAIMRYILHYTKPGDIVFDGFCGTGMTGVAAQMCGTNDSTTKYAFTSTMGNTIWGKRNAIMSDLSPAATFIAYCNNCPSNANDYVRIGTEILQCAERELSWLYETEHEDSTGRQYLDIDSKPFVGRINYVVWSDVLVCPNCSKEIVFYDVAIDRENSSIREVFACPHCRASLKKTDCDHAQETHFDNILNSSVTMSKQIPVLINYSVGKKRFTKKPSRKDIELISSIENMKLPSWVPSDRMPEGGESRRNDKYGITHVHHFYSFRNLYALSYIWDKAKGTPFQIVVQSVLATLCTKLVRYNMGHRGNGVLSGTLYLPSLIAESNVFKVLAGKFDDFQRAITLSKSFSGGYVNLASTTDISNIQNNCVDYIFTDPPFGSNLSYSELSFIWEAWLQVITARGDEAIINEYQSKRLVEYQRLMERCFAEYYRVIKPGRWMTVEFHNSQNSVWNAMSNSLAHVYYPGCVQSDRSVFNALYGEVWTSERDGVSPEVLWHFLKRFYRIPGLPNGRLAPAYLPEDVGMKKIIKHFDGVERLYYVFTPSCYDGKTPLPVVLVLHGYSGTARCIPNDTDWHHVAESRGFIVIFAQSYINRRYGDYRVPVWNAPYPMLCDDATDDTAYILSLMQDVERNFNIDSTRRYMTGHSNGGMMTARIAYTAPKLFAANGIVQGFEVSMINFDEQLPVSPVKVPFWGIVGMDEQFYLPFEGRQKAQVEKWLHYNGQSISGSRETCYDDGKYHHRTFYSIDGRTPLIRYTEVIDCGHNNQSEFSWLLWEYFCKFSRVDGKLYYEGMLVE